MSGFTGRLSPYTVVPVSTVSAVAQLDIVIPAGVRFTEIRLNSFDPVTTNTDFQMLFSTNSGSTYDTTTTNYRWMHATVTAGVATGALASGAGAVPVLARTQIAGYVLSAVVDLTPNSNAGDYQGWNWRATYNDNTAANFLSLSGGGLYLSGTTITNVRFKYASGNIANGTYAVTAYP